MGIFDLKEEKTIRRNLRGASIAPGCHAGRLKHSLESVKKTRQVAVPGLDARTPRIRRDLITRSGYVIANNAGNDTPRDAGCGAVRRDAAHAVCDVMVPQPRRVAPGW